MIGVVLGLMTAQRAAAQAVLEPVLNDDVQLRADRATVVDQGAVKLLLLEGDVSFSAGGFGFRDQRAVVRITRRPGPGKAVRDFAIVFDKPVSAGEGGVRAQANGLLVTLASQGKVELSAQMTTADRLPESELSKNALERILEYDQRVSRPMRAVPDEAALTPEQERLREQRRAAIDAERREIKLPEPGEVVDSELVPRPVLPARGTVRYGKVDRIVYQRGEEEDAILLLGGVRVMYQDEDEGRDVLLTAQNIVIFLSKDTNADAPSGQVDAGRVRGIYLEDGAVVSDGTTTVRSPRAFYDLKTDRAILLDAVVYSYDLQTRVPLYLRADVIRQTSADTFRAEDAVFTTSEFAKPHLSIGASRITLQQIEHKKGEVENWVTAEGVTVNAGQTPFFYWPTATLKAGAIPIRKVKVGYESDNGANVQTTWDLFALAGMRSPDGVDFMGNIDHRGEHGLGLGTELQYQTKQARGAVDGYFLPNDSGTDEIAKRNDVGFDGKTRGFIHAQHRQTLPAGWEVWLEANHVSDPTFLEEFFPNQAYAEREFETSAYFKKAEDDWATTALIKGQTNDFTTQYAPLLTPGYSVNKLPEFEYRQITSIFDDHATLFHESRAGRMRAVFGDDTPGERGFTAAQSAAAFGITPTTSFHAAALASGFPTDMVSRVDSRTEISAPNRVGVVDITPFAVGRVTAYDQDFGSYNGGNNDQARLWGGLGVRTSTAFSKTNSDFSSRLLDVNGLRHIIEPNTTLAVYDATMSASDLPIYDPEVERLIEGGVARFGVLNTWQTRRGGMGRERTIDWLTLQTDVVLVSDDAGNNASLGRYYGYRPEYTLGDDHFYTELMWAVTEATAFTGEFTERLDDGSVAQWRAGIENQHTDRLSSFINYREIDVLDARLLSYGAALQLTTKYKLGVYQVLDFGQGSSRSINLELNRRIPRANLALNLGYDDLDGQATLSIVLTPDGSGLGLNPGGFFGR